MRKGDNITLVISNKPGSGQDALTIGITYNSLLTFMHFIQFMDLSRACP